MGADQVRVSAGVPTGGQFAVTSRAESGITLTVLDAVSPTRFGPNTGRVLELLGRVSELSATGRTALAHHAPIVVSRSSTSAELLCPNADATRYEGLVRYRRLVRDPQGPAAEDVAAALAEAGDATRHLPAASREAVKDAVCALVARTQTNAHAYDILTRAVRLSLGPIHPEDGPVRG